LARLNYFEAHNHQNGMYCQHINKLIHFFTDEVSEIGIAAIHMLLS